MAQIIIDVSEWDGDVDWQVVKESGNHAIIRTSVTLSSSGAMRADYKAERNMSECERLGIPYGCYHYSIAYDVNKAREEAQFMLDVIGAHKPSYPLYFDTEQPGTESMSKACAEAFGDIVESAGYWCGVYASQSWWQSNLQGLERFTKWVAKWSDVPPTVADTDLWQNRAGDSDAGEWKGYAPGVGLCDLNVLLRENLLAEVTGENIQPPSPEPEPGRDLLTYQQRAAEVFYHMCTHDGNGGHGYSQVARWGDGTYETLVLSDGTQVRIPNGDFDCSSGVITAWEAVLPGSTRDATYTGNMKDEFLKTGLWKWHPMGDGYIAQVGDIYLNEVHHTAMCLSAEPDMLMQFSISENGTVHGQQGDQTGQESNVRPYYSYPWDGKLVYVGPQPSGPAPTPDPDPIPEPEPEPRPGIDVDGYWGNQVTSALQEHFGTPVDGEVWHQWASNVSSNPGLTSGWKSDNSLLGSPVVVALQKYLGVAADGIIGSETIRALQSYLGTYVDGVLDAPSNCVVELQRRLNAGTF